MRYRILPSAAAPGQTLLAFRMPERAVLTAILGVASGICLIVSLAYGLGSDQPSDGLRALCFLGFGLFCFSAIFLVRNPPPYPAFLHFDNDAGLLGLLDGSRRTAMAVPYADLRGLTLRRTYAGGVVVHSVGIDLARGGRWELLGSQKESRARRFLEALEGRVDLRARGSPSSGLSSGGSEPHASAIDLPGLERSGGGLRFRWRRKTRPSALAVSLLAVVGFAVALFAVQPFATGPVGYALAVGFAVLLLGASAAAILGTIGERCELEIARGSVRWSKRSALSRGRSFEIPTGQIAAVDLSFTFSRAETSITLLRPAEVERFTAYRDGAFRPLDAIGMVGFLRSLARIDVSALAVDRRFMLAEVVREAISRP